MKKHFTKLDIVNAALLECGLNTIQDFGTESGKTSTNSELMYDLTYQQLLEKPVDWTFAKKERSLDLTNDIPLDTLWKGVFQLPSDFVRFVKTNHTDFEIRSNGIYSQETTEFILTYIAFMPEASLPSTFINALIFLLASRFAFTFKRDKNLKTDTDSWSKSYPRIIE